MTREEARHLLPIIQAYADGKNIQYLNKDYIWEEFDDNTFSGSGSYRIKPEPKYRPFSNSKECWEEMQKHQPFGWVKCKNEDCYMVHIEVNNDFDFKFCFKEYIFTDGTPFGIKE